MRSSRAATLLAAASLAIPSTASATPATHGRTRTLNQVYSTHNGYEYRTEHFIAVATTSGDDARWAGEELEAAWDEAARLADHFGTAHRRTDFGMVGAMITGAPTTGSPVPPRVSTTRYPRLQSPVDSSVIQVELGVGGSNRDEVQHALRKGAATTLLKQSGYAKTLPAWAAAGFTEFVADEAWSDEKYAAARDEAKRGASEPSWELLFRYLMTADDASGSADLLASFGDGNSFGDDSANRLRRRVPIHSRYDHFGGHEVYAGPPPRSQPDVAGKTDAELREKLAKWLANPQHGGPLVDLAGLDNGPAGQRAGEMMLLVKLWQRTAATDAVTTPAADFAAGGIAAKDSGPQKAATPQSPIDLNRLRQNLLSDRAPMWSTLDADGRLLTWRDRERIDDMLPAGAGGYRSIVRDGRAVLQQPLADGTVLEAWYEKAADTAGRDVIRVRRVRASQTF